MFIKKNIKKNGRSADQGMTDRQTCPYFQELEGIVGSQPNIHPVALSASRLSTHYLGYYYYYLNCSICNNFYCSKKVEIDTDTEAVVPIVEKAK